MATITPRRPAGILRPLRALPLVAAALVSGLLTVGASSAEMPAGIVAPGESEILTVHAMGAQVYECKAGENGALVWTFREPTATLILAGKTVGRHYAGPNWDHVDGSGISAKVAGKAPGATAADIPWLRLEVTAHRGGGMLTAATTVQRINTSGGAMSGPCDTAGAFHSVPYAADYVFLGKTITN
jgi:hypothetical protein